MNDTVTAKVLNPNKVEIELRIVMSVEEWRQIQKQLPNAYPARRLSVAIGRVLETITDTVTEEIVTEAP